MTSIDYFGESLEYAEDFPAFAWAEFQEAIDDGDDAQSQRSVGVALRLAVACVAEKDRGRFRKLSRQHNAKVEDWLKVAYGWMAAETERPTQQPTDSSDGLEVTRESSASEPVASVTELPKPANGAVALALARSMPA